MARLPSTIKVSIMSPEEVVWEGDAEALSSENAEGPFDILPGHANFITIVKGNNVTLHFKGSEPKSFSLEHAVIFFHDDLAKIYIHTPHTLGEPKK